MSHILPLSNTNDTTSYGTLSQQQDNNNNDNDNNGDDNDMYTRATTRSVLWIRGMLSELSILVPFVVLSAIIISTIFYNKYNKWELSTSLYFSCQALVGIMYEVPAEDDRGSQLFTLILYILGSTCIYGAIAAYVNLIAERAVQSAKDIVLMESIESSRNGIIRPRDWCLYMCNKICYALDWNNNK